MGRRVTFDGASSFRPSRLRAAENFCPCRRVASPVGRPWGPPRGCPQPSCPGRSAARLPEEALRPRGPRPEPGPAEGVPQPTVCSAASRPDGGDPPASGRAQTASPCPGTPAFGPRSSGLRDRLSRASCLFRYVSVVTVGCPQGSAPSGQVARAPVLSASPSGLDSGRCPYPDPLSSCRTTQPQGWRGHLVSKVSARGPAGQNPAWLESEYELPFEIKHVRQARKACRVARDTQKALNVCHRFHESPKRSPFVSRVRGILMSRLQVLVGPDQHCFTDKG